jgi:hypothetical protein
LKKPVIRHKDTKNIQPTTCAEAKKEESITFDQNGAFRVMRARRITIDGIAVDGGGPYVFGANGIWLRKAEPRIADGLFSMEMPL